MSSHTEHPPCRENSGLALRKISKRFGNQTALDDVSFQVDRRQIVAVLGPSGSGKSTLLMIIAGLEKPDGGSVCWDGAPLEEVPVHQRGFGLMFQDFALFPHKNVYENIAFGLRMGRLSRASIQGRVKQVLEQVGLPGFEGRDVNTLSGGEAQRVALARSLAPYPRLLMLDEPLGSLDRNLRERLMLELRQILRKSEQTALYVTHDQEEAFAVADRVVVLNQGRVIQIGSPIELYRQPRNAFVARFLGLNNLIPGRIYSHASGKVVETPIGTFPIADASSQENEQVQVLIRPDAVSLDGQGEYHLQGRLLGLSFRGSTTRATIASGEFELNFDFPSSSSPAESSETVTLSFQAEQALQILRE